MVEELVEVCVLDYFLGNVLQYLQEDSIPVHLSYLGLFPSPQWFKYQERKIDEVLLWSLMRKESSFYLKAKSPRSARGLLQLMPSTARTVTKDRSIRGSNLWKLYDLEYLMVCNLLDNHHRLY